MSDEADRSVLPIRRPPFKGDRHGLLSAHRPLAVPVVGLIIIGAQLHGNPVYLGPAITFALVEMSSSPSPWP